MALTRFSAVKSDAMGIATVSAGDATANLKDINLASAFDTDTPTGFIVRIMRSNVDVTADSVITLNTTTKVLRVADGGSTYNMTAGDIIHYIVF